MTDTTPHHATPEQWESLDNDDSTFAYEACILELRARVEALEVDANEDSASTHFCFDSIFKRLESLEAGAAPSKPAPVGSLVERVAIACAKPCNKTWDDQARAAIREVAEWLRERGWENGALALEQEAER